LSAYLALLLLVLSTSRYRALRLVQKKTAEISHQALHDGLTGLPNRGLVADRAEQLLLRTRRHGTEATALYLDLDGFKTINDTLGHEVGDALLVAVADRLRTCVRGVDTIGRLGGDEFVILLEGNPGAHDPESIATRVLEAIRTPFALEGTANPVVTTISIGVATGDRAAAKDLIRDADVALYQAKDDGRDGFAVYRPDMDSALHRRSQLEYDLRTALDEDQFMLLYQPIYDLETLDVIGFEALLRWNHPEFGTVSPGEFIPLLEASGEIVAVGRWVLVEACQQIAQWRVHHPSLFISVNVSAVQLGRDSVIDHVKEALHNSGLDPSGLTIEITETALMSDIKTATERLYALKRLGVQLAIDDFGSGYSSLAYVQTLPVNSLKIDQSFIRSISSSDEANLIVHSMVELGRKLGLRTVAEGVETVSQLDQVRTEHVDEAQGFLFSRPVHPTVIESWIRAPGLAPVAPEALHLQET
jgi:Amt family ammonium transporter